MKKKEKVERRRGRMKEKERENDLRFALASQSIAVFAG